MPMRSPRMMRVEKSRTIGRRVEGFPDTLGDGDELAGAFAPRWRPCACRPAGRMVAPRCAQPGQLGDPAHVALAPAR